MSLNEQIVDSVTQTNVKTAGEAPAMAIGNVSQTTAEGTPPFSEIKTIEDAKALLEKLKQPKP